MRPKAATVSRWAHCCTRAELLSFASGNNSIFVRLGQCCAGLSRGARDRREIWAEATSVLTGPVVHFKEAQSRLQSDSVLGRGYVAKAQLLNSWSVRRSPTERRPRARGCTTHRRPEVPASLLRACPALGPIRNLRPRSSVSSDLAPAHH